MEFAPEGPKAIPLWVNGHAYLTVTDAFFDVVDPANGEAIYRVPLCGNDEAAEAVGAARAAQPAWAALPMAARQGYLDALAAGLDRYTGHFAKLLRKETGFSEEAAQAEVAGALAALRGTAAGEAGVVAIVVDAMARIGRKALKTGASRLVAAAAFAALFFFAAPFPLGAEGTTRWLLAAAAVLLRCLLSSRMAIAVLSAIAMRGGMICNRF